MKDLTTGSSSVFIIHPGETLKEVLEERNYTPKELALRTGFSEKHISKVLNGDINISPPFAKQLEYVFDNIPASFWNNLQRIYDEEMKLLKNKNKKENNDETKRN